MGTWVMNTLSSSVSDKAFMSVIAGSSKTLIAVRTVSLHDEAVLHLLAGLSQRKNRYQGNDDTNVPSRQWPELHSFPRLALFIFIFHLCVLNVLEDSSK